MASCQLTPHRCPFNPGHFSIVCMDEDWAHWSMRILNIEIVEVTNIRTKKTLTVSRVGDWWYYSQDGVSREAKDPREALAQVLWNII